MGLSARQLVMTLLILMLGVGSAWAQSEFVEEGQDAAGYFVTYSNNDDLEGLSVAFGAGLRGRFNLGVTLGYASRKYLSVKSFAVNSEIFVLKQDAKLPLSAALTGSFEIDIAKYSHGAYSSTDDARSISVGGALYHREPLGRTVAVIPMVALFRVIQLSEPKEKFNARGAALQFAFGEPGKTLVIVSGGVVEVDDLSTVSVSLGIVTGRGRR